MSAKYWQRGETIDYTATDDLANGDVVNLATRIGVAGDDIAAGETGAVHVVGVFEMPKATGAVTVGQALYWDAAAENITSLPASSSRGWAWEKPCFASSSCRPVSISSKAFKSK